MPKPRQIDLPDGTVIPILYEDRAVLAIDKPAGWLLVPSDWEQTSRNLQRALESSLNAGDFWARSRNLKYLRFVHRLDAETSGVLLLAKSPGALPPYSKLFEGRNVAKLYLAVVAGVPAQPTWTCKLPIAPDPARRGRMRVAKKDNPDGKAAETHFRVLQSTAETTWIEARPITGRTHQIRVHLQASGHSVLGDPLYGTTPPPLDRRSARDVNLALRAVAVSYRDPFAGKTVRIQAPWKDFVGGYGFESVAPPGSETRRLR